MSTSDRSNFGETLGVWEGKSGKQPGNAVASPRWDAVARPSPRPVSRRVPGLVPERNIYNHNNDNQKNDTNYTTVHSPERNWFRMMTDTPSQKATKATSGPRLSRDHGIRGRQGHKGATASPRDHPWSVGIGIPTMSYFWVSINEVITPYLFSKWI